MKVSFWYLGKCPHYLHVNITYHQAVIFLSISSRVKVQQLLSRDLHHYIRCYILNHICKKIMKIHFDLTSHLPKNVDRPERSTYIFATAIIALLYRQAVIYCPYLQKLVSKCQETYTVTFIIKFLTMCIIFMKICFDLTRHLPVKVDRQECLTSSSSYKCIIPLWSIVALW